MRRFVRMSLAVGALLTVALASACGSSEKAEVSNSSAGGQLTKVTFYNSPLSMGGVDAYVAAGAHYFADAGIDYETSKASIQNSSLLALALQKGEIDMAIGGTTGAYSAFAAGQPVIVAAVDANTPTVITTVSADAAAKMKAAGVTADSPLRDRLEAMRSLTITTTAAGGTVESLLRQMFRDFSIPPPNFSAVTDQTALANGVRTGALQAVAGSQAVPASVEGDAVVWVSPKDAPQIPSWSSFPYSSVMTTKDYTQKSKAAVDGVRTALQRAHDLMQKDPDAAMKAARPFYPDMTDSLFKTSFDLIRQSYTSLDPTQDGFKRSIDSFNEGSSTKVPPNTSMTDLFYSGK